MKMPDGFSCLIFEVDLSWASFAFDGFTDVIIFVASFGFVYKFKFVCQALLHMQIYLIYLLKTYNRIGWGHV